MLDSVPKISNTPPYQAGLEQVFFNAALNQLLSYTPSYILANQTHGMLVENMQTIQLQNGITVFVGTDAGVEDKKINDDRIVVRSDIGRITLMDGMAESITSDTLAGAVMVWTDWEQILEKFRWDINNFRVTWTTLVWGDIVQVWERYFLRNVVFIGDSALCVFSKDGKLKFCIQPQLRGGIYGSSQKLAIELETQKIGRFVRNYNKEVGGSPSVYVKGNVKMEELLSFQTSDKNYFQEQWVALDQWDIIFMASDGASCSISEKEIGEIIENSKTGEEIYKKIAQKIFFQHVVQCTWSVSYKKYRDIIQKMWEKLSLEDKMTYQDDIEFQLSMEMKHFYDNDFYWEVDNVSLVVVKI